MEQDWSTVRGKKYHSNKIISKNTNSHNYKNYNNNNLKRMEQIISANINNVVLTEFSLLQPFNNPVYKSDKDKDNDNLRSSLIEVKWGDV